MEEKLPGHGHQVTHVLRIKSDTYERCRTLLRTHWGEYFLRIGDWCCSLWGVDMSAESEAVQFYSS